MKLRMMVCAALAVGMTAPAARAADNCTAYEALTNAVKADVDKAFQLMRDHKIPEGIAMIPTLQAYLARIPAAVPAPQACKGEVLVYDLHQFLRFSALEQAGKTVPGYPAGIHFVRKDLPFVALAYAVGWFQFENKDFAAAKISYAKGLAIGPGDHDLTSEMVATLLNQANYPEAVATVDRFLAGDTDIDNESRSRLVTAKGVAQLAQGDKNAAIATLQLALQIDPSNQNAKKYLDQLQ